MSKKMIIFFSTLLFSFSAQAADEFETCYSQATDDDQVAVCMKEQTARLMKQIQQNYRSLLANADVKKWNNGDSLSKGNLKDTYNSWLAYRNRYCSLFRVANTNMYGSPNYHYERCMKQLTEDHLLLTEKALEATEGSVDEVDMEY